MKTNQIFLATLFFPFVCLAQINLDINNNVGIGTTSPSARLHVITAATTGNGFYFDANTITTGLGITIPANGLTTGTALNISSTSTAGTASNTSKMLNIARSGANSNSSHIAYGIYSSVLNSGTTSTNVAGYFIAGGATNNYALLVPAGNVGIGLTDPGYLLEVNNVINSKGGKLYVARSMTDLSTRRNWSLITESNYAGDFTINESFSNVSAPTYYTRFCILSGGNVGIGTTNPGYKLHVSGTAFCTSGAWESDSVKKKNIQNLAIEGLSIIKQLRPVTYEWKTPLDPGMQGANMGFIVQDIEKILPTMVLTRNDSIGNSTKSVKFLELLPVIIKGIQEQQTMIDSLLTLPLARKAEQNNDSLMREIENLKTLVNQCCTAPAGNSTGDNNNIKGNIQVELANKNNIVLYQNEPNPFSNQTIIRYFVPENVTSVFVVFHDEFGREVNKVKVTEKGFGKIEASTENLADGMYSYSIIVDGKMIDTKKMMKNK